MSESRKITMKDGRVVEFGEKQKMDKSYSTAADGSVTCRIDFDNSETILSTITPGSPTYSSAAGHGLSQKLGDAAAGAESTADAFESVLEVAARLSKGEWSKARTAGEGGSAKGASELLEALVVVLKKDKDFVRALLGELSQSDKLALRKTEEVAKEIEKIKAARAPSKAETDKVKAGADLLGALKAGGVPKVEAAAPATEALKAAPAPTKAPAPKAPVSTK